MKFVKLKKLVFGSVCLIATGVVAPVFAETIKFNYSATINQVGPNLSSVFSVGQVITGSYQFESTSRDSAAAPTTGLYFNSGSAFSVSNGTASFLGSTLDIDISNLPTVDIYRVAGSSVTGPLILGYSVNAIVLSLADNISATALANDLLPLFPPNLAGFNVASFTLAFTQAGTGAVSSVQATVTTLSRAVTAVPSPSTALLLLIGLSVFGFSRAFKIPFSLRPVSIASR